MELYLVRHAIAEDQRPGRLDADRALTPDGRARFERSALGLARLGLVADRCWHSPWRRAAETAQLLGPALRSGATAEPLLAAAPGEELLDRLAGAIEGEPLELVGPLALVGHEPWLGELAAWLCFGDPAAAQGLSVRKGGCLWLRGEPVPGGMVLEAALKPSLLRRVGALAEVAGTDPEAGHGARHRAD
jgi:phosphohistidine phosphatase